MNPGADSDCPSSTASSAGSREPSVSCRIDCAGYVAHVHAPAWPTVSTGSANKEARRGKTRRRHLLFTAMALGPGLVLAEGVGSAFCPLSLSRRLRLFAPPALPDGDAPTRVRQQRGESGLLERTIASDATYAVAGNRIASRGTAASWAKGLALRTRPRGDRCGFPHRRAGSRKQPCFAVVWSEKRR